MRTSFSLARAQLRHGWAGLLGIAVLIALVGGLVLAGVAGAQRTRTAVDRMIAATGAADVLVNPSMGDESVLDYDAVAALPMVEQFSRLHGVGVFTPPPYRSVDEMFAGANTMASDGGAVFEFDRPVLVAGRLPAVEAVDEVYMDESYAENNGYSVGDTFDVRVIAYETLDQAFAQLEQGSVEAALELLNDPALGSIVSLRVVGIGNMLDSVAIDEGFEPFGVWIGPAVYSHLGKPSAGYGGAVVRLTSPEALEEFKAAVNALGPGEKIVYQTLPVTRAKALNATEPSATALAVFALVTALLGVLLTAQAISRRFQLDARDNETLAALGTTRWERFLASLTRLLPAGIVGVLGAVALGSLLSMLTPVGPAARAEPHPGFDFDAAILLWSATALLVVVMLLALLPAWRNAGHSRNSAPARGSAVATWLAARGASAAVTTGVRFGLEPGRGRTAVPTRATAIAALTAVAVATATIVFASSLDRVVNDGRFYGSNFDVAIDVDAYVLLTAGEFGEALRAIVATDPATERTGLIRISEISVNGRDVTTLAFSASSPSDDQRVVEPTIAGGRAPLEMGEIALGRTTMNDLDVSIGDTVSVEAAGFSGDAEVVGRAVLPGVGLYQGSDRTSIGVGALLAFEALDAPGDQTKEFVVVRFHDDADPAAFEARLQEALSGVGTVMVQRDGRPSDILSLARLRSLPVVLASILVVLVSFTVLHAMVVAVRRRRRDIGVLQALGATSRELTAVGVWQGVTIGVVALALGLPFGIVVGRWCWILLANGFGTLAEPVVPPLGVLALAAGVLALTAAAGVIPIRRGLHRRPAEVLRSE